MTDLIKLQNIYFKRNNRPIFEALTLQIPQGKITAIMGPSGTGKTTLLRLIGGQLIPDQGKILFDGQDIHQLSHSDLFKMRHRMGMLFQNSGLFTHLNVFENVAFPLREHTQLSPSMIQTLVMMKLQMVGLRGAHELMPNELSGGMARRVALARAIALDPEFMMYDEPFSGQDPISMGVLVKLIRTLSDTLKLTSIVVSHDVAETLSIADYVYVVAGGGVIGKGTPDQLRQIQSPQLQQFLQGLPDGPVPFHYPSRSLEKDFLQGV